MTKTTSGVGCVVLAAAMLVACGSSAPSGSEDTSSGSGSGAGSGKGGDDGDILGQGGDTGSGGGSSTCASATAVADLQKAPADIIWIVDQSGSMGQETQYVQEKINDFAAKIDASGVDYHVVMIADPTGGNAICVPPPLAGPDCGDGPRFRLVPTEIGSHDGPQVAVESYPAYSDFLRVDATKHFVFVTDDDSNWSAAEFTAGVEALQPAGMFDGFKVHAIYAFGNGNNGCSGPFGSGASEGTVYTELVAQTQGAAGVICTGDWTAVFTEITTAVQAGAKLPCVIDLPDPPDGETLDTNLVNVVYQSGAAAPDALPRVAGEADCGTTGGWHYDDEAKPTQIVLCAVTCDAVQKDENAKLTVELGCVSVTK